MASNAAPDPSGGILQNLGGLMNANPKDFLMNGGLALMSAAAPHLWVPGNVGQALSGAVNRTVGQEAAAQNIGLKQFELKRMQALFPLMLSAFKSGGGSGMSPEAFGATQVPTSGSPFQPAGTVPPSSAGTPLQTGVDYLGRPEGNLGGAPVAVPVSQKVAPNPSGFSFQNPVDKQAYQQYQQGMGLIKRAGLMTFATGQSDYPDAMAGRTLVQTALENDPHIREKVTRAEAYGSMVPHAIEGLFSEAMRGRTVGPGQKLESVGTSPNFIPSVMNIARALNAMGESGTNSQPNISIGAQSPSVGVGEPGVLGTGMNPAQFTGSQTIGKQATDWLQQAKDQQAGAQTQLTQLGDLTGNLENLNTSAAKDTQLKLEAVLHGLARVFHVGKPYKIDLSNAQVARKTIVNFTAQATSAVSSQPANQMMKFIEQSQASLKNTPKANEALLGWQRGLAEYMNQRGRFANEWTSKNGTGYVQGVGTAQGAWQAHADPWAYILQALPQWERQEIFDAAKKNKTLSSQWNRAVRSYDWLEKNGYGFGSGE